jgi:TRAP-type transport system small permease protein
MHIGIKEDEWSMKQLRSILENLGGVLVGLLFLLVLLQIVARVILHVPTSWTVELGRVLFVAVVFLGAALLVYTGGHLAILTLYERLSGIPLMVVDIINTCIVSLCLIAFSWGCFEKTVANWNIEIPTLEWMTNGYMYLVVLLGGLLMLFYTIYNIIVKVRRTT